MPVYDLEIQKPSFISYYCQQFKMETAGKPSPEYSKACSFRAILAIPPMPPRIHPSVATINNLLRKQILPARPERVTHIEARYKLDDSSSDELSLEGYLQHSSGINPSAGINRYQLKRWFDAEGEAAAA